LSLFFNPLRVREERGREEKGVEVPSGGAYPGAGVVFEISSTSFFISASLSSLDGVVFVRLRL